MVSSKLLRVTQMNAIYFDKEIFNVFQQQIQEFLKYLPPGLISKYDSEINFLLRLIILNYSVLTHNCTFGQKLLSIKYNNLTRSKKIFMLFAYVFDYFKARLEISKPSHVLNKHLHKIDLLVQLLRFVNISLFLRRGEKPLLIERVLGLNQAYCKENVHRHYEDKYMTRELIWNGFIEILVYILPLINYHKITRTLRHFNPLHKKPQIARVTMRKIDVHTRCPHCDEFPILPHHMGCSHIFCYSCLKGNQVADSKYECPICEYTSTTVICDKVFGEC